MGDHFGNGLIGGMADACEDRDWECGDGFCQVIVVVAGKAGGIATTADYGDDIEVVEHTIDFLKL